MKYVILIGIVTSHLDSSIMLPCFDELYCLLPADPGMKENIN